jgi:HSP20 family protein
VELTVETAWRGPDTEEKVTDMSATPVVPVRADSMSDWPGSPLSTLHGPEGTTLPIAVEEFPSGDRYLIRFELPGIDARHALDVSVDGQVLVVHAERPLVLASRCHTHFRYGSFCSHVSLPAGADPGDVIATYQDGILEVSIGLDTRHEARKIEVATSRERS